MIFAVVSSRHPGFDWTVYISTAQNDACITSASLFVTKEEAQNDVLEALETISDLLNDYDVKYSFTVIK